MKLLDVERCALLTAMPSFLATHSHSFNISPLKLTFYISEKLEMSIVSYMVLGYLPSSFAHAYLLLSTSYLC